MPRATRVETIRVDWDQDGTFLNAYSFLQGPGAERVRVTPAIRITRGRDQARSYSPPMVGRYSLTLDNQRLSGPSIADPNIDVDYFLFTREDAESPLHGKLEPGKWLSHVVTYQPLLYMPTPSLFRGLIDDIQLAPSMRSRSAALPALGVLSHLQGKRITTHLYQNITVAEAINVILERCGNPGHRTVHRWGAAGAATCEWGVSGGDLTDGVWGEGWLPALKDIDASAVTLAYWWLDDADAFGAVMELLATEGPGANLYETADGQIVFRNRTHRSHDARSIASNTTFEDGEATPTPGNPSFSDIGYVSGLRDIINDAALTTVTRLVGQKGALDLVWGLSSTITLAPNAARVITVTFDSPPIWDVEAPKAGEDYSIAEGTANVALSNVSSTGCTISIVAGPSGVTLTGLKLRGKPTVTETKVWETNGTLSLGSGDVVQMLVVTSQPCTAMYPPIDGIDFAVSPAGYATVSLAVLGAQRAVLTITATGACIVSGLKVRGCPVTVVGQTLFTTSYSSATATSQARYGVKSKTVQCRQDISAVDAQTMVDLYAAYYREPRPVVTLIIETGVGEDAADDLYYRMAACLGAEIGDRITIADAYAHTFNGDVFIEQIDQTIESGGDRHTFKLTCESAEGVAQQGRWGASPTPVYSEWGDGTIWG